MWSKCRDDERESLVVRVEGKKKKKKKKESLCCVHNGGVSEPASELQLIYNVSTAAFGPKWCGC